MDVIVMGMNDICRTCKGTTQNMRYLFENADQINQGPRIDEMLMACAAVQVCDGDGLPSKMCEACLGSLKNAFAFRELAQRTDSSLRETIKESTKVQEIKQELQHADIMDTLNTLLKETGETVSEPPVVSDYIQMMDNNQMLLTCRECMKVFTTLEGLRCHKRVHTGGMFKCKQCNKEYTRLNHLQRHEASHGRRKVHVCRICNKTLTRLEHLKRHLTTHLKDKPFGCPTCNRGFNRIEHLQNHQPRCKGENVHICHICNKAFNREDSLEVHKKLHENIQPVLPTLENLDDIEAHYYEIDYDDNMMFSEGSDLEDYFEPQMEIGDSIQEPEKITLESETLKPLNEPETTPLQKEEIDTKEVIQQELQPEDFPETVNDDDHSDSSDSEYQPYRANLKGPVKRGRGRPRKDDSSPRGKKRLKRHKRGRPKIKKELDEEEDEVGEFPCPLCQEMFTLVSELDRHAKIAHAGLKVHKCSVCSKEFNRSNHLKRHMDSHNYNRPYQCLTCTKSFNRKDHLTQHEKLHEREKTIQCDMCFKAFHREDYLAKHMASKHGIGEKIVCDKKFECNICHKKFTTEKYRDIHVKGHSGEKEYQCKTCEKRFLSKSHLTEHMKFHNEHSKKFLCSECGQRFIRNDYLVIHMRRHRGEKPFKCKYCGKGFPRTTDLTVHERYHTGEKTHLCTICGRGFGRAYNLTVHMRTHTGEKPYQCTYCEAAFAQGNDLKAHVRRHTGERFQCELCTESFLMGYLLTQHKRNVHGLNVVSNIRRLQPVHKIEENVDEPQPITIPLPKPVVPDNLLNTYQAQLAIAQLSRIDRE